MNSYILCALLLMEIFAIRGSTTVLTPTLLPAHTPPLVPSTLQCQSILPVTIFFIRRPFKPGFYTHCASSCLYLPFVLIGPRPASIYLLYSLGLALPPPAFYTHWASPCLHLPFILIGPRPASTCLLYSLRLALSPSASTSLTTVTLIGNDAEASQHSFCKISSHVRIRSSSRSCNLVCSQSLRMTLPFSPS